MFYVKEQRKRIEEKSLRLSFDLIIGASQVEYYDEILITLFEVDSYFCKSLMSANKISFIELDNNCKVIIDEYYFICKNIMIQLSGDNWYLTFDELLNKLIKE